ncbi:MAG: type VI secretion system tip protein TssI/VgrG [Byssovorax sp.]
MAIRTFSRSFSTPNFTAHSVLAFRTEQRLGRPTEAHVTVQLAEYVEPDQMIGLVAQLSFNAGDDGPERLFGGIIEAVTLVGSTFVGGGSVHHVKFHVVSTIGLLARVEGCEIFQELDVKEIITKILAANQIPAAQQEWKLSGSYPKREYCVQYNESVLAFVSRLMEEEGIYFRTEMRDDGEHVIFEDDSSNSAPIEGQAELPFRQRTGLDQELDAIYSIAERRRVVSGKFVLRDYDFKRPKLEMTVDASSDANTDLEVYDFPGLYVEPSEGKRLAKVRLEAEQAARSVTLIESDCTRIDVGHKIKITDALHDEIDGGYVVVAAVHELGYSGGKEAVYHVSAELVPEAIKYRSPRVTPAPIIEGPQTAKVVAPAGAPAEDIHTDEHGRCKVKFNWDLGPARDDKASCWMRTGQLETSGSMMLPRIDWEVVVEFLEGNPDRPIVSGRLYNGVFMPPYALPEGKTRTSMQTSSTPGGGGANEIRFEDNAGAEEIMIHAEYDQNLTTANNKVKNVGKSETVQIKVDSTKSVGSNEDIKITMGFETNVKADQSLSVGADRTVQVNAVTALNVGGASTTTVGGNHFEMDGNPLKALLAIAAERAAEVAKAAAGQALNQINAAVQSRVDQAMGPINGLQQQMSQIGAGMQAVANGDMGGAAPLLAQAAGLPSPGAFANAMAGGGGAEGGGGGEAAGGEAGGAEGGEGGGEGEGGLSQQLGVDAAVNSAIDRGASAAADALGSALGLDSDGGGGSSQANEAGLVGDVAGVDSTDRAKGPGHNTAKVTGTLKENAGSTRIRAVLSGVHNEIAGDVKEDVGAAKIEMILGNRTETVGGGKTETALGLVIISRADETEKVTGSKMQMVGGAILEKIGGGHSITAGSPASFVGAFHKIEAATSITLKCGASEVVIDDSGIAMKSPIVTITAGKISMTKAVSEM